MQQQQDFNAQSEEYLISLIQTLEVQKKEIQKSINNAQFALIEKNRERLDQMKQDKDEPFGTFNISDKYSVNVPKNISYDQDFLASLYYEIGDTAAEYIKVKYEVSETKYKSWPEVIKKRFMAGRTVKEGKLKLTFKKDEK